MVDSSLFLIVYGFGIHRMLTSFHGLSWIFLVWFGKRIDLGRWHNNVEIVAVDAVYETVDMMSMMDDAVYESVDD